MLCSDPNGLEHPTEAHRPARDGDAVLVAAVGHRPLVDDLVGHAVAADDRPVVVQRVADAEIPVGADRVLAVLPVEVREAAVVGVVLVLGVAADRDTEARGQDEVADRVGDAHAGRDGAVDRIGLTEPFVVPAVRHITGLLFHRSLDIAEGGARFDRHGETVAVEQDVAGRDVDHGPFGGQRAHVRRFDGGRTDRDGRVRLAGGGRGGDGGDGQSRGGRGNEQADIGLFHGLSPPGAFETRLVSTDLY